MVPQKQCHCTSGIVYISTFTRRVLRCSCNGKHWRALNWLLHFGSQSLMHMSTSTEPERQDSVWKAFETVQDANLLSKGISSRHLLLHLYSLDLGFLYQHIHILLGLLQLGKTLQQHTNHQTCTRCYTSTQCALTSSECSSRSRPAIHIARIPDMTFCQRAICRQQIAGDIPLHWPLAAYRVQSVDGLLDLVTLACKDTLV